MTATKQFGKYRATVMGNSDPEALGRLQLLIPDVLGQTPSSWAEACLPCDGTGATAVPPIGAAVWAEFEAGDAARPIWSGCRRIAGQETSPATDLALRSPGKHAVVVSDQPATATAGGVVLHGGSGATIVVNASGIYLDNGRGASITLIGPTTAVNGDGLTVT